MQNYQKGSPNIEVFVAAKLKESKVNIYHCLAGGNCYYIDLLVERLGEAERDKYTQWPVYFPEEPTIPGRWNI